MLPASTSLASHSGRRACVLAPQNAAAPQGMSVRLASIHNVGDYSPPNSALSSGCIAPITNQRRHESLIVKAGQGSPGGQQPASAGKKSAKGQPAGKGGKSAPAKGSSASQAAGSDAPKGLTPAEKAAAADALFQKEGAPDAFLGPVAVAHAAGACC